MTSMPAPGASAALARRLVAGSVIDGVERPITVDQTNVSVVVDECVIVKWFVPAVPHPHRGIRLLEHLRAVRFTDMPAFFAAEVVDDHVVATVSEFVAGALDGWDWFVDELTGWVDGTVQREAVLASAAAIGALGGRLHLALSTPSEVLSQPVVGVDPATELRRCSRLLDEALALTDGEPAAVLAARADRVRALLDLVPRSGSAPAISIHGDLHIGQLLRAAGRMVVTDFDGNPLLDPAIRHSPRPAAVDVASLVQSVDHAGRVAQQRRPDAVPRLDPLIAEATEATLDAHRRTLADEGGSGLLDEQLLWPLRVGQELHELVYAARHLPRWAYAPTATLRSMLPDE